MDKAAAFPGHLHLLKLATQACSEHNEETYLEVHGKNKTMHEFMATRTHKELYIIFQMQYGIPIVGDLEKHHNAGATVTQRNPFILTKGGFIDARLDETVIILVLGYLRTYPSTPKPARGLTVAEPGGDYEPMVTTLSVRDQRWSRLSWETGTYIRVPPLSQVKVDAGVIFGQLLNITFQ